MLRNKQNDIDMSSNKNIPHLRFPGFTGEWEEKEFGEVGIFVRGLSYKKNDVTTDESSTLVIRSNNIIQDGSVDCNNGLQFVTKLPSDEQLLRKGDITICLANGSSNLVGKSAFFDGDYIGKSTVGAFCGIYRSSSPITKYLVQTEMYKNSINLIKQGGDGALANLYGKDILGLKFKFPTLAEQQKITDCLSTMDNLISAQGKKVDTLKEKKRGMMQQMFPQKGEISPRLRFPGFTEAWEEKLFSDVFTRCTDKNAEDNKNVLTISAQYGLISQLEFFKKSVAAADVTGYYLVHKGDFAYNRSSSQGKPVGTIKPLKLFDKGVVSTLYIVFRCKDPNAKGFWEQYFDAGIFDKEIMTIAQEGARNHGLLNVPTNDFFCLNVLSPSPAEQHKIAECLFAMDDMIASETAKLNALKNHKKGLMQQLFPQPNK